MNGNAHKCGRSFFLFSVKWVVPLQAVRIACCRKVRSRSAELDKKAVHDSDIKIQMIDSVVYPYPKLTWTNFSGRNESKSSKEENHGMIWNEASHLFITLIIKSLIYHRKYAKIK